MSNTLILYLIYILLSLCIADEEQYRPCIKNLEHKMKITQPMLVDMTEINFKVNL